MRHGKKFINESTSLSEINSDIYIMKQRPIIVILVTLMSLWHSGYSYAQSNAESNKWTWLIGSWKGENDIKEKKEAVSFSLKYELDKKIIVRKCSSEVAGLRREDMIVIYFGPDKQLSKAIFFDSKGNTTHYAIEAIGKTIVFTTEKNTNSYMNRLTYTFIDNTTIGMKFETSKDGVEYHLYSEGKCKRQSETAAKSK